MRLYHYLETKWALDDIRRRRLKVSYIPDMNDPYELKCARSEERASQIALDQTMKEGAELYSGLCFSRSWNNILMWSHYAEKHKGICLGFDVPDQLTRDVRYIGDLVVTGDADNLSKDEKLKVIELLYWAKYKGWCYEEEVRTHSSREEMDEETGQYFVNFGDTLILREVIAGARFPMSRKPIDDALKGYSEDVKIVKAVQSTERFEIIVNERGFDR